jgi:hypothetical protein
MDVEGHGCVAYDARGVAIAFRRDAPGAPGAAGDVYWDWAGAVADDGPLATLGFVRGTLKRRPAGAHPVGRRRPGQTVPDADAGQIREGAVVGAGHPHGGGTRGWSASRRGATPSKASRPLPSMQLRPPRHAGPVPRVRDGQRVEDRLKLGGLVRPGDRGASPLIRRRVSTARPAAWGRSRR